MPIQIKQTDYSPPQAATICGTTKTVIYHHIETGELVAYNIGTKAKPRYRISEKAIEDFRQRRTVKSSSKKTVRRLV